MIWGYIIGNKLGPIAFIDGIVKKEVYIGMLEEYFLLFLDVIYIDDSKMTYDWFKYLAEKYDLHLMELGLEIGRNGFGNY